MDTDVAFLEEIIGCDTYKTIKIDKPKFTIGRGAQNSCVIPIIQISRIHCQFSKDENGCWTIEDSSLFGTFVNGHKLERNHTEILKDGDKVQLGPSRDHLVYRFKIQGSAGLNSPKKLIEQSTLQSVSDNTDTPTICLSKNNNQASTSELPVNNPNIMELKLKELQNKLIQTEQANKEMMEKLKATEDTNKQQIEEMKRKQAEEKEELLAKLQTELLEKERVVREKLKQDIQQLQDEKAKIEVNITSELQRQNAESEQLIEQFRTELDKVKNDLSSINQKKQALEHQLQDASNRDEKEDKELIVKAKADILNDFNNVMENELQCSICNELYIVATTLNCMHTFCQFCIDQWKQKKNECPVCRTKITALNRTIALDNFIDKMVENLTEELKAKRKDLIAERKSSEEETKKKQGKKRASSTRRGVNTRRGRRRTVSSITSHANTIISLPSTSSAIISIDLTGDQPSDPVEPDSPDEPEDRDYVEGLPHAYYGGYGFCYKCGAEGHWANGCPEY